MNFQEPILVTGATGHIGNVLVRKLVAMGAQVRVLILPDEDTHALQNLPIEQVYGDVLDLDSLWESFRGCAASFIWPG